VAVQVALLWEGVSPGGVSSQDLVSAGEDHSFLQCGDKSKCMHSGSPHHQTGKKKIAFADTIKNAQINFAVTDTSGRTQSPVRRKKEGFRGAFLKLGGTVIRGVSGTVTSTTYASSSNRRGCSVLKRKNATGGVTGETIAERNNADVGLKPCGGRKLSFHSSWGGFWGTFRRLCTCKTGKLEPFLRGGGGVTSVGKKRPKKKEFGKNRTGETTHGGKKIGGAGLGGGLVEVLGKS